MCWIEPARWLPVLSYRALVKYFPLPDESDQGDLLVRTSLGNRVLDDALPQYLLCRHA